MGPFGSGTPNDNSDRLISYCSMHGLTIVGSWFQHLDIHRQTWMSHDGVTSKEIDHVITRFRDKVISSQAVCIVALKPQPTPTTSLSSQSCVLRQTDQRSNMFSFGHATQRG